MKKVTALILAGMMLFSLTACGGEGGAPKESPGWTSGWEPYYTGDTLPEWEHEDVEPWDSLDKVGWTDWEFYNEHDNSKGLDAYDNMASSTHKIAEYTGEITHRDIYAGYYINVSGTLTIMLVNPTEEIAGYYGEICKTDIWVIAAQFTWPELYALQEQWFEIIDTWLQENPDKDVEYLGGGAHQSANLIELWFCGLDCAFMEEDINPPHYVYFDYNKFDSSLEHEIPYEPVNKGESPQGIFIELDRTYYPVGLTYIVINKKNESGADISTGTVSFNGEYNSHFTPVYFKYHDGEWNIVTGNYFYMGLGGTLEAGKQFTENILSPAMAKRLGPGLYRVSPGSDWYPGRWDDGFYLEFAVTKDTEKQAPIEDAMAKFWIPEDDWVEVRDFFRMDFDGFKYYDSVPVEGNYKFLLMLYTGDMRRVNRSGLRFAIIDVRSGDIAYITEKDELYSFYTYYIHGDGKVSAAGQVDGAPAAFTASLEDGEIVYYDEPFPVDKYMESDEVRSEYFSRTGVRYIDIRAPRSIGAGAQTMDLTLSVEHSKEARHLYAETWLQKLTPYGWETVSEDCGTIRENVSQGDNIAVSVEFDASLDTGLYRLLFSRILDGVVQGKYISYEDTYYGDLYLGFIVE